jgi:hypothetical protein
VVNPAVEIERLAVWLSDAAADAHRALRNMREAGPGFPSSTPGSGSVGGGHGGGESIVERLALAGELAVDQAMVDADELRRLVGEIRPRVDRLRTITGRWGFAVPGEWEPRRRPRPGKPTEHESNAERWCRSHERIGVAEPVRARGLCRWCAEFEAAQQMLPPLGVLEAHARGQRITTALIEQFRVAETPPRKSRSRKKRRR